MFRPTLESLPEGNVEEGDQHIQDTAPPDLGTFDISRGPSFSTHSVRNELVLSSAPEVSPPARHHDLYAASTSTPTSKDFESPAGLTNAIIAKVQKHCRFAISSLDYEDEDQAKKELRAALALLGD